jgi:hypothetical protein
MARRPYRSSNTGYSTSPKDGLEKMSKFRVAVLRTLHGSFSVYSYPWESEDEEISKERGRNIFLYLPGFRGRQVRYNLSGLTQQELEVTRAMFNLAFDLAEPVVKHRDKVANDALAAGDDSYARVYRALPVYAVRPGPLASHNESVRLGFKPVPGVDDVPPGRLDTDGGGDADGGDEGELREPVDEVAADKPLPDLTGHDRPEVDGDESLGEARSLAE